MVAVSVPSGDFSPVAAALSPVATSPGCHLHPLSSPRPRLTFGEHTRCPSTSVACGGGKTPASVRNPRGWGGALHERLRPPWKGLKSSRKRRAWTSSPHPAISPLSHLGRTPLHSGPGSPLYDTRGRDQSCGFQTARSGGPSTPIHGPGRARLQWCSSLWFVFYAGAPGALSLEQNRLSRPTTLGVRLKPRAG